MFTLYSDTAHSDLVNVFITVQVFNNHLKLQKQFVNKISKMFAGASNWKTYVEKSGNVKWKTNHWLIYKEL